MNVRSALILGTALLLAPAWGQDAELNEDQKILHVLNRFTLGATPELVKEVRAVGIRTWFQRQLKGDVPEPDSFQTLLSKYETLGLTLDELYEKYAERPGKNATPKEKAEARRRAQIPTNEMMAWILLRAVYSNNTVRETNCDFFRNHLSVSIDKGPVRFLVVDWEREVIVKHALGNFGAMLEASAKHPAMLYYLDNALSRRPPTDEELKAIEARVKRRTGSEERAEEAVDLVRQRGLNENYARELLELHTLGVDRYYTQQDVIEVAKCLTGWTIGRKGERATFRFVPSMHCPGDKMFLGTTIREDRSNPISEGEQVLDILKKHEGTARFLAWKLCRYYVNDTPDEEMVKRVAKVFHATEGDLPRVLLAMIDDPQFFNRENYRTKFKRPFEFVISALRVTRAEITDAHGILRALSMMSEPLYRCADPTGYYDQAEAWKDPGAMAYRWVFASDLANGRIGGVKIPSGFYKDLPPDKPQEWKAVLVDRILPVAGLGRTTSEKLDALIEAEIRKDPKAGPEKVGPVIVAALLGSPEFQKQ